MCNTDTMTEEQSSESGSAVLIWQVYKIPIILGSLSLLCIALSVTIFIKSYQVSEPITFSSDTPEQATVAGVAASNSLMIDIEGAVVNPGVYQLPFGSRVEDAIVAAGGFSRYADADAIARVLNRAAKLSDGAKLFIPRISDRPVGQETSVMAESGATVNSGMVSLNSASQSELEALSGVGPATAKKIIAGRPYQTLDEVVHKKAMSQMLFTKLKDQLSL